MSKEVMEAYPTLPWYQNMDYETSKKVLQEDLENMKRSFVSAGYCLKHIRDKNLYLEDGYKDVWQFAEKEYGLSRSTASRWMSINDRFSEGGNSTRLAERYRGFGKSQLQEMLSLTDEQVEAVTLDMTVKEIRKVIKPEPEKREDKQPEQIEQQLNYCPPGQSSCIRQEWGTDPKQQETGKKECEKCWASYKKAQKQLDSTTGPGTVCDVAQEFELEECNPQWFILQYFEGASCLNDLIKICEENQTNSIRGKKIQEYLSPYGAHGGNTCILYYDFYSHAKGVRFKAMESGQEIKMTYTQLAACLEEIYGPFGCRAKEQENEIVCCKKAWPELLADIPRFTDMAVMDCLEQEEHELKEYLNCDGMPGNLIQKQQMIVAGLRLLRQVMSDE